MKKNSERTWVAVDTRAIVKNFKQLQKALPKNAAALAVVKGDAYGHGMIPVAKALAKAGAEYFAVFDISEGIALRKAGIRAKILILRSIFPSEVSHAIKYDLEISVTTFELLSYLKKTKLSRPLSIHIMTDTGLGRDGFLLRDCEKVIGYVSNTKNLRLVGLASHFAASESREFDSYTKQQAAELKKWQKSFADAGLFPIVHLSSTAGIFLEKEFGMGMARFGIGIYGLWPSEETKIRAASRTKLVPALSWKTVVNEIKTIPSGSAVGYDLTHTVARDTKVAVLPVGYADGYPRSASDKGIVLVHGKRAKVLGRVMMNMTVVDVTDIPKIAIGDTVTLIGKDGKEYLSSEEVAGAAGTINYELVTRIDARIKRVYR